MQNTEQILQKLQKSSFRSRFHLSKKDIEYINKKGLSTIQKHAEDFIKSRLAPAIIPNDGKQTPMKNHPIFIAQHACACCCRGCLQKWYQIPKGIELTKSQQQEIVNLLMTWIKKEL